MNPILKMIFCLGFFILMKAEAEAQPITWQRLYNGPSHKKDFGLGVCQINDGNFIVVGSTQVSLTAIYVLKLKRIGDTIWTKTIGGYSPGQLAYSVTASNDGGFVFTGDADTAFAIKMNAQGNIVWHKKFGQYRYVQCYDIQKSNDGGFIGCGRILQGGGYVFKINSDGYFEWEKIVPGEFTFLYSVSNAHNEGFILTGSIYDNTFGDTTQALVVRLSNSGNIIWQKRFSFLVGKILNQKIYKSVKYLYLESSVQTSSGDFIFAGTWGKNGSGLDREDIYVLKTDSNLNAPPMVSISSNHFLTPEDFKLYSPYPNPFNPNTTIKFELKRRANVKLKIFNMQGKEILELLNQMQSEGFYSVRWDASKNNSGVYFCEMIVDGRIISTVKLILLK